MAGKCRPKVTANLVCPFDQEHVLSRACVAEAWLCCGRHLGGKTGAETSRRPSLLIPPLEVKMKRLIAAALWVPLGILSVVLVLGCAERVDDKRIGA